MKKSAVPLDRFLEQAANDRRLLPTHISLFAALFYLSEGDATGSFFRISRRKLLRFSRIRSVATYHKRIKELADYGYIIYKPSYNPFAGSRIAYCNDLKPINQNMKPMKKHQQILEQLFKVLNSYMPQQQGYYDFLTEVMQSHYFLNDTVLYEKEQVVKQAYFLASGYAIAYYYNDDGERQIIRIYEKNDIIGGKSFTDQTPSEEYLTACRDSYWLSLSYNEVQEIYKQFPDTQEQSRRIMAGRELKELEHKQMLALKGNDLVLAFYKRYPELLHKKIIRDGGIASYLLMGYSTLRAVRAELLKNGLL